MEYERKGVTITWQIENVESTRRLYSPVISIDELDGTRWRFVLFEMSASRFWLTVQREERDDGPQEFGLYFQLLASVYHRTYSTKKKN